MFQKASAVAMAVIALLCFMSSAIALHSKRIASAAADSDLFAHKSPNAPSAGRIELAFNEDIVPPSMPGGDDASFLQFGLESASFTGQVDMSSLLAMPDSGVSNSVKATAISKREATAPIPVDIENLPGLAASDPVLHDALARWVSSLHGVHTRQFDWESMNTIVANTSCSAGALLRIGNTVRFIEGDAMALSFYRAAIAKLNSPREPISEDRDTIAICWEIGPRLIEKDAQSARRIFAFLAKADAGGAAQGKRAIEWIAQLDRRLVTTGR